MLTTPPTLRQLYPALADGLTDCVIGRGADGRPRVRLRVEGSADAPRRVCEVLLERVQLLSLGHLPPGRIVPDGGSCELQMHAWGAGLPLDAPEYELLSRAWATLLGH